MSAINRSHQEGDKEDAISFIERKFNENLEKNTEYKVKELNNSFSLYDQLISNLEKQVRFLEEEIIRKDNIIEKLIERRCVESLTGFTEGQAVRFDNKKLSSPCEKSNCITQTLENNQEGFEFPKKFSKHTINSKCIDTDITHANKFDVLQQDNDFLNEINDYTLTNPNVEDRFVTSRTKNKKRNQNHDQNLQKQKRCVAVVGDSIVKEIKGHLLSSESNKVVVKSFSGATTKHMYD